MSEKRFEKWNDYSCKVKDNQENTLLDWEDVIHKLNEQQNTIENQKRIIKSQDAEISRQYNLCLAMSGILREEFGVYDVFDRSKDKRVK